MTSDVPKNSLDINLNHNVTKDVIGFPAIVWHATKEYSVNDTLPIAAVNTWLQFTLAYIAAVVITRNDLSFITNILNSRIMPAYVYASIIFGVILVASLAIKHMNRQEIKDEKSKDGDSPIDEKIRGGHSDGMNRIAQNALTIEIVPDMSLIGNKKENFSIVLPVSGKQGEILENKRQENRNKVILLTVPYVLSGLVVVTALGKFGFTYARGWEEWTFIAVVSVIAIAGICIALSKLKSNEVNNACNLVKKFNNVDILLPFRSGTIVSVMENKFESKEENDPISRLIKLLDTHLTNFTDKIVNSFDKCLGEIRELINTELLGPANDEIKETLVHLKGIREDIKKDLDGLHKEISEILNNCKGLTEDVNSPSMAGMIEKIYSILDEVKDKVEGLQLRSYIGYFQKNGKPSDGSQHGDNNEFFRTIKKYKEKVEQLQNEVKELKKQLEELKNKQAQSNEPNSSLESEGSTTATPLDKQRDEEKKAIEKSRLLRSIKRTKELEKENAKLEKEFPEQEEINKWQKSINGKASDFLYYLLESIKLGKEATLRNFNNRIIIHWKDGSQTTCHIEKQGNLPSTKVDFVDQNIQAAFAVACAG